MEIQFQDVLLAAARKLDSSTGQSKSVSNILLPRSRKQRERTEFASNVSELCELIRLLPCLESQINGEQSANGKSNESGVLALREFATTCERCNRLIADLQREVSSTRPETQLRAHREAMVESLQSRFKQLCTVYNANANAKLKKLTQQHDFSKLGSSRALARRMRDRELSESGSSRGRSESERPSSSMANASIESISKSPAKSPKRDAASSSKTSTSNANGPSWYVEANSVSEEEAARFETEFTMMYDERASKMSEIRTLETQLNDIQRLQDVLAEHVLEQEERIDVTHTNVVAATDNIKLGNEHLHRAMQNTARMRIWILFVLLVCTFTLHFLHWYND